MSKQYNKGIKRARRVAYNKRKVKTEKLVKATRAKTTAKK